MTARTLGRKAKHWAWAQAPAALRPRGQSLELGARSAQLGLSQVCLFHRAGARAEDGSGWASACKPDKTINKHHPYSIHNDIPRGH